MTENQNLAGQLEKALRDIPLESSGRSERIKSLINSGESDRVEFKSTLRWIGLEYAGFIRFQLVPVDNKKVLLVECQPSPAPVFFKIGKDEDFYVRIGPGNRRLSTSEVLAYVMNRKTKL